MLMRYLVSWRSLTVVSAPANRMPAHRVTISAHIPLFQICTYHGVRLPNGLCTCTCCVEQQHVCWAGLLHEAPRLLLPEHAAGKVRLSNIGGHLPSDLQHTCLLLFASMICTCTLQQQQSMR
jgi:hypothetical protein